jgi:broad specificity phosphatase PhoE
MKKLLLIRHGQSIRNAGETVQGSDSDPANTLSEKGRRQALALGRMLARQGILPAEVWSSPLVRARETGDIVLKAMSCSLPVHEDDRLREMCKGLNGLPGGLEGRRRDEVKTPEYREGYTQDGWDFRHGSLESGGETARETGMRYLSVMDDIADSLEDGATAFVFGHGQGNRYGVGAALGFPDIQRIDAMYKLGNCERLSITRTAAMQWQSVERMTAL